MLTDTVELNIEDGDTTVGHLLVTRFYLARAAAALRKEPVANCGGHIEQAILNADRARRRWPIRFITSNCTRRLTCCHQNRFLVHRSNFRRTSH